VQYLRKDRFVATVREDLRLLREFKARAGCGVLVNTSFNVRGERIVGARVVPGPGDLGHCPPGNLRPVHAWGMRFAEALGWVNNRLILGALFFALITPTGWVRRRLGGDPMARRYDASTATYRKPKNRRSRESLERPF